MVLINMMHVLNFLVSIHFKFDLELVHILEARLGKI